MIASQPNILLPREGEARLLWAIVVSGIVHAATILAVVVLPGSWGERATPSVSYTVDLVASADPAGTNLPAGSRRKEPAAAGAQAPAVAALPKAVDKPPQEKVPVPQSMVLPKVEPVPPQQKVAAKPPPVVPPKPAAPKPEADPAQKADLKLGSKAAKETPPKAKRAEPTAVLAKATVAAPALVAKPRAIAAQASATKVASETQAREQQIAVAVQRRVADQQIADAVQRRADAAQQRGAGSGAEGTARGGPLSIGQGTRSGGVVEGLDMILYRGQMERRIKENWVWAGDNLGLEVKVQFDVTETGQIQNVRITVSSGNPSYDASAERAVRAASPLAPPPEKYRDLFVRGVEITFRAQDLQS